LLWLTGSTSCHSGIIGIALGTAILPALSRFIAQNDPGGAQRVQSNAIELGLLLTVPASSRALFSPRSRWSARSILAASSGSGR
jgi:Na+-driven multidrug efflux pump